MKDMYEVRHSNEHAKTSIESKDIIGKKVLDKNGRKIGEVGAIHIHPRKLSIEGIRINKGVMKKDNFIGKNYIRTLGTEGAVLKITPVRELVGMKVYDAKGNKIGEVKKVHRARRTNNLTTMIVDRGLLKRDMRVSNRDIDDIGNKVISLKKEVRD